MKPVADMAGKVALVTGGGAGIGRAIASAFAARGASVVVGDMNVEAATETASSCGDAIAIGADVGNEEQVSALIQAARARFGGLDYAVNNAGILGPIGKRLHDVESSDWELAIRANLTGVFLSMKYELAAMMDRGGGSIVNISSIMGLMAAPRNPSYSAAKHGVIGLTRSAAVQYAADGIRINALCPGMVETGMQANVQASAFMPDLPSPYIPIGRSAQPSEIAELAVWLCSDASSYLIGEAIGADGGWRIV